VLPALVALVTNDTRFDIHSMPSARVEQAIENGLGPILARVTRDSAMAPNGDCADHIKAADLTARVLTAELLDALEQVLLAADSARCDPVLLKGCSTASRYYPEPHLRTMGDIDLFVSAEQAPTLESAIRACGFRETAQTSPSSRYEGHHHRIPLWHPDFGVWIEVHTCLYPLRSPLAADPRFFADAIGDLVTPYSIRGRIVKVMKDEFQLVYTSTRWAENPRRSGAFPILDAALLISARGEELDWELVCALAGRSWGVSALRLMLGYLYRWQLSAVPSSVMRRLALLDQYTNQVLVAALHRFVTKYVMEAQPPGTILTSRNLSTVWTTLAGPATPAAKLWKLPMNIAFPSGKQRRLDMAAQRMRSLAGRLAKR
jgi:hypothetical protein